MFRKNFRGVRPMYSMHAHGVYVLREKNVFL